MVTAAADSEEARTDMGEAAGVDVACVPSGNVVLVVIAPMINAQACFLMTGRYGPGKPGKSVRGCGC